MTTKTLIFQIADDDQLLPGVEGKIVVWVEEGLVVPFLGGGRLLKHFWSLRFLLGQIKSEF